ncbi:MAG: DUF4956 domain-containing protein [Verrucomicrobia bacterium]|nr:DUF4956 domain-containing protein [Verrucomicrobiota bacterium]
MDELIKLSSADIFSTFTLWEAVISVGLAFVLSLIIGYIYRITHRGTSYSQAYVQTMVMMSFTVAVIMLIIGSNIARAFSLVGALSIIRFRNAMKETRDVGFIFLAMAIGMACRTRFYVLAVVFTVFACFAIYAMFRLDIGAQKKSEVLLKVQLPAAEDYESVFHEVFYRFLDESSLIAVETVREGMFNELIYSVQFRKGVSRQEFLDEIRKRNGGAKVSLKLGQQNINV